MNPYAKYSFKNRCSATTQLVMYEHSGKDIPYFPPEYITPYWNIPHSIIKTDTSEILPSLHLTRISPEIHLSYIPEIPDFTYGYFREDAVLVNFERNNSNRITGMIIWFFEGMKQQAAALHHKWISCQLELD